MTRLTITVEVSDQDPAGTDPHDVAESIIAHAADLGRRYTDEPEVTFVSAEWEEA